MLFLSACLSQFWENPHIKWPLDRCFISGRRWAKSSSHIFFLMADFVHFHLIDLRPAHGTVSKILSWDAHSISFFFSPFRVTWHLSILNTADFQYVSTKLCVFKSHISYTKALSQAATEIGKQSEDQITWCTWLCNTWNHTLLCIHAMHESHCSTRSRPHTVLCLHLKITRHSLPACFEAFSALCIRLFICLRGCLALPHGRYCSCALCVSSLHVFGVICIHSLNLYA